MRIFIKRKIKDIFHSQSVSWSNVVPKHQYDGKKNEFTMISPAGVIKYKPNKDIDLTEFRNKYINTFQSLVDLHGKWGIEREFFVLYNNIKKDYKVKYKANIGTRLRGLKCNLGLWF